MPVAIDLVWRVVITGGDLDPRFTLCQRQRYRCLGKSDRRPIQDVRDHADAERVEGEVGLFLHLGIHFCPFRRVDAVRRGTERLADAPFLVLC